MWTFSLVANEYSAIMYVCSYMVKGEHAVDELLQIWVKKTKIQTIKEQVNKTDFIFMEKGDVHLTQSEENSHVDQMFFEMFHHTQNTSSY